MAFKQQRIVDVGLLAGKIMIESGAEMHRAQDTMQRILRKGGIEHPEIYTTPTGIFLSADRLTNTRMVQINHETINLYKVTEVNALSRQFVSGQLTLGQLEQGLQQIERSMLDFPLWLKAAGAFLLSCTLMILFVGEYDWFDFVPSGIVGTIGYLIDYFVKQWIDISFISTFLAATAIALLAVVLQKIHCVNNLNYLIIGAVMPLVPGVSLTNALRDLMARHLISGLARMGSAILSAMAIGGGIAMVLRFF